MSSFGRCALVPQSSPEGGLLSRDTARAMSQENVEAIRVVYDRLNQTREANRDWYAPDATLDGSRLPGLGVWGFDQFYAAWLEYRDTFDEWWIEVEELLDGQGERVFAAVRDGGRLKASGAEVHQRVFHVWELQGGKIIAQTFFLNRAEALEAAGLSE
jgi:ketosteroid isomerase-like protein